MHGYHLEGCTRLCWPSPARQLLLRDQNCSPHDWSPAQEQQTTAWHLCLSPGEPARGCLERIRKQGAVLLTFHGETQPVHTRTQDCHLLQQTHFVPGKRPWAATQRAPGCATPVSMKRIVMAGWVQLLWFDHESRTRLCRDRQYLVLAGVMLLGTRMLCKQILSPIPLHVSFALCQIRGWEMTTKFRCDLQDC